MVETAVQTSAWHRELTVPGTVQTDVRTVEVPGASLYVEVRGLGTAPSFLPGAHGGWGSDPQEFADGLRELLAA